MNPTLTTKRADWLGAVAGFLCFLHCVATPLLFVAHHELLAGHADEHGHAHGPAWWWALNYAFVGVALVAVWGAARRAARHASAKRWLVPTFYLTWLALALVVFNEQFGWVPIPEVINYLPALGLVGLHLYNRQQCRCVDDGCRA